MSDETPKSLELVTRSIYGQKVGDDKPGIKNWIIKKEKQFNQDYKVASSPK
jgi:hypothetical protein